MSELKINTISSLSGSGIKINSPVGVNTNCSSSGLRVSGKITSTNSLEVVTVSGSNYGIKIKAPRTNQESVLRFSNSNNVERSSISSNSSNDLIFKTGGALAGVMKGNGVFEIEQHTQFNKPVVFNEGSTEFTGTASFNNYAPKCVGTPVSGEQIINLDYLRKYRLAPKSIRPWAVFGGSNNSGVNTSCCGKWNGTWAKSVYINAYQEALSGKFLVIALYHGIRGCSCYDNETYYYPIDGSYKWYIDGNKGESIKNTITRYIPENLIYNVFGLKIRVEL